jgi:hypothetical protein
MKQKTLPIILNFRKPDLGLVTMTKYFPQFLQHLKTEYIQQMSLPKTLTFEFFILESLAYC